MSKDNLQFNKAELLAELTNKHMAESSEKLDTLKGVGIETVTQLEKVVKSLDNLPDKIKIPEPPSNEETHKLLKEMIEETKKPCEISIELNLI